MEKAIWFDFGGERMCLSGDTIECPSKQTFALLSEIKIFVKDGIKRPVGINVQSNQPCFIWDDGTYVHIDCLKELRSTFHRRYAELLLKSKKSMV